MLKFRQLLHLGVVTTKENTGNRRLFLIFPLLAHAEHKPGFGCLFLESTSIYIYLPKYEHWSNTRGKIPMSQSHRSVPLSAESCCGCQRHPVVLACLCCPAGAGAAGPRVSFPAPAGISPGLWRFRSTPSSGNANYQGQNNTGVRRWGLRWRGVWCTAQQRQISLCSDLVRSFSSCLCFCSNASFSERRAAHWLCRLAFSSCCVFRSSSFSSRREAHSLCRLLLSFWCLPTISCFSDRSTEHSFWRPLHSTCMDCSSLAVRTRTGTVVSALFSFVYTFAADYLGFLQFSAIVCSVVEGHAAGCRSHVRTCRPSHAICPHLSGPWTVSPGQRPCRDRAQKLLTPGHVLAPLPHHVRSAARTVNWRRHLPGLWEGLSRLGGAAAGLSKAQSAFRFTAFIRELKPKTCTQLYLEDFWSAWQLHQLVVSLLSSLPPETLWNKIALISPTLTCIPVSAFQTDGSITLGIKLN